MFRLRRSAAEDTPGQDAAGDSDALTPDELGVARSATVTAGKGRPTPKRSEAERRRRQPYTAPKDRKEASRVQRTRGRDERSRP